MNSKNMNNKQTTNDSKPLSIIVYDHPLYHRLGLSTLLRADEEDNRIERGDLVSEVGPSVNMSIATYPDAFKVFNLRSLRYVKKPSFIFGKTRIGDTYSAFIPKTFSLPAVGANITIDPWITKGQDDIINMYNFINATVTWIVHVPSPIGTGIYLKIYAPEMDTTTETRGVRFKPSANPTIAVSCPFSNDLSMVPKNSGRLGQSGGSIVIYNIEDNSNEDINTPLLATIWCCVHNVNMTGYKTDNVEGIPITGLNFKPITVTPEDVREEPELLSWNADMDTPNASNEITAEGGVDAVNVPDIAVPSNPIAPVIETQAKMPKLPHSKAAKGKFDAGHLNTKWLDYQTVTLQSDTLGVWNNITIDPSTVTTKGEAFNLPWKRNVWTSGQLVDGVIHTLLVQFNIARAPQISGVLQVRDTNRSTNQYLISFGEKVEIPVIPIVFSGASADTGAKPRYYNNNWIRTNEAKVRLAYRLIAFNRTATIADVKVKIAIKPGYSIFQVPIKPKARAPSAMALDFMQFVQDVTPFGEILRENADTLPDVTLSEGEATNPSNFITPFGAITSEGVSLHEELGDEEMIDLDEFPVTVQDISAPVGEIIEIPINLPAITDIDATAENAITQKFQRFAHVIPKSSGPLGPIVGNYTIKSRLPTGIAGEIEHVCLPGDMSDSAMIMIFGLSNILSMATSALSAVGGPLINGIVNTVAPILSGAAHAIGGDAIGGLVDGLTDTISGIVNPSTSAIDTTPNSIQPTPGQRDQPSSNPSAIAGDIPISRFVEFLKPVLDNYTEDPVLSTLLLKAKNFVNNEGAPLTEVPLQLLANMRNVKVERNVFNRTYDPSVAFAGASLTVSVDMVSNILEAFQNHPNTIVEGTKQNGWYKRFISVLINNINNDVPLKSISMNHIRQVTNFSELNAQDLTNEFKSAMDSYRTRKRV